MIPRFKAAIAYQELTALLKPAPANAVSDFETLFATKMQQKFALAFPYGRTALYAILKVLGLDQREIICPAYTCVVVAHAIVSSGNTPVFIDSDPYDANMDLALVEQHISDKTGAIIITSIFGHPVNIEHVENIRKRYPHLYIIQDCAHSFAAQWHGRQVNTVGHVAFYGLNISKLMTSIFGGMITTDDAVLAQKLQAWREHELTEQSWHEQLKMRLYLGATTMAFNHIVYGVTNWLERQRWLDRFVKYYEDERITMPSGFLKKMSPIQAMIGVIQTGKYDEIIKTHRACAAYYHHALRDITGLVLPPWIEGATYSHFAVRVNNRKNLIQYCQQHGVQLGTIIDYVVPTIKCHQKFSGQAEFTVATEFAETVLNLPVWSMEACHITTGLLQDFFAKKISMQKTSTRIATAADIEAIVNIHGDSLSSDVFPKLGKNFLRRYYSHVINSDTNQAFVATSANRVVGFIAVSLKTESIFQLVTWKDLLILTYNCIMSPRLLLSTLIQLKRYSNVTDAGSSEITFFAVDKECRGCSFGSTLIFAAMSFAKSNEKKIIKTKTSNKRLADFYRRKFGAQTIDSFAVLVNTYEVLCWKT